MPGAYTHISIARLLSSGNVLRDEYLHRKARSALLEYPEFCHMGAISPDYPYLNIITGKKESEHWANAMHHKYGTLTKGNILHIGIDYLKNLAGDEQLKCLAWFLGYASHVTADVTCHPVTNLLVGDYEADSQVAHRESELHQDVYIFSSRLDEDVRKSEHIKNVVGACNDPIDKHKVEPSVEKMWKHMLLSAFPDFAEKFKINIHDWHSSVQFWLEEIAEELSIIPSRHIRDLLTKEGVSYPRIDELNRKYIDKLSTPKGEKTYDDIFDHAMANVKNVWKLIAEGIFSNNSDYINKLRIWNLDTGQDVKAPEVLWKDTL
jgi:hypothetical protein